VLHLLELLLEVLLELLNRPVLVVELLLLQPQLMLVLLLRNKHCLPPFAVFVGDRFPFPGHFAPRCPPRNFISFIVHQLAFYVCELEGRGRGTVTSYRYVGEIGTGISGYHFNQAADTNAQTHDMREGGRGKGVGYCNRVG
jgi:hypothetical protein